MRWSNPGGQVESDLHGRNHVPVARQTGRIRFAGKLDDLQRTPGWCGVDYVGQRAAASGSLARNSSNKAPSPSVFLAFLKTCAYVGIGAGEGDVIDGRSGVQAGAAGPRIGRMPRDCRSAMVSRASCWNRATLIVSSGSMMSMRWCGTAACSSAVGLAVPTIHATVHLVGVRVHDFGPLPASARRRAMAMPNPVLPDAVG